jgi:hypothetical protein
MGNSSYVRTGLCPGFVGSSGKSLGLKLRARLPLYSPTFREHKFSETEFPARPILGNPEAARAFKRT